jgi:uncharacterized OB-fold protein
MTAYTKPLPVIYPWTAPFWEGARQSRLMIQRGKRTGKLIMYPKKYSPHDYTEKIEWIQASGKGKIYTYSIVYRHATQEFQGDMPYVLAVVELEEGVRMCTNIVDTPIEKIACDAPVEAVFSPVTDEVTLVKFHVVG